MDKYYFDIDDNIFYTEQNEYGDRTEVSAEEYEELLAKCTDDMQFTSDMLGEPVLISKREIERREKRRRVYVLQHKLAETDYIVTKLAEMQLSGDENFSAEYERYKETIQNRVEWRAEANRLLAELNGEV